MKYPKQAKTREEQAELLLSRGLIADKEKHIAVLSQVNYYRLSTYLYTFRDASDCYLPGTSLEQILKIYEFDHELRNPVKLPQPKKYPEWFLPCLSNRNLGAILYICSWISEKLVTKDYWRERAVSVLKEYEDLGLENIGMPKDWKESKIWKI